MVRRADTGEVTGKKREIRFEFGANWQRFLDGLTEENIVEAERSLTESLGIETLRGKTFLDIGSGSGLFSLVARRLGARVHSFDYDPRSVACTAELKRRYFAGSPEWTIEQGSVLDEGYMESLGVFDIVYSWGVLHHTGAMWRAMEAAIRAVADRGILYIAIYNDQGKASAVWLRVKRLYNTLPPSLRILVVFPAACQIWGPRLILDTLQGAPLRTWMSYAASRRGMSPWRDVVDWVGGYPFEVAAPEAVFEFCRHHGFTLQRLITKGGGIGCNEFVFRRG